MTGNRNDDERDPRLLTGAYSLDALDRDEAEAFERGLLGSESLRHETDELLETATVLGLAAAPVAPSARLKAELMAKLGETPQLPREHPATVQDAEPTTSATVAPVVPIGDAAAGAATSPAASAAGSAELRAQRRWYTRPIGIVTAVAAAAALFVGGGIAGSAIVGGGGSAVVIDAAASQLAELTAAGDAQRQSVELSDGATATVVWSNELGRSAVMADGLSALPDGKVYEAWYIDETGAVPAGTFTAAASGTSWHVLDGAMKAGDIVGVTVEPAGGSTAPTTDPILVVQSA